MSRNILELECNAIEHAEPEVEPEPNLDAVCKQGGVDVEVAVQEEDWAVRSGKAAEVGGADEVEDEEVEEAWWAALGA